MLSIIFKYGITLNLLISYAIGIDGIQSATFSENGRSPLIANYRMRPKRFGNFPGMGFPTFDFIDFTNAMAVLHPKDGLDIQISGEVNLTQFDNEPIFLSANLTGLEPGSYSFHVNEYGDLGEGCDSTGSFYPQDTRPRYRPLYYNGYPFGASHLGFFTATEKDTEEFQVQTGGAYGRSRITLSGRAIGDSTIAGRSLALYKHKKIDEDQSQRSNPWNPTEQLELMACGIIVIVR